VKIRILVVDDEQDNCDYLKLLLGKEGFEVTTVTDPRQTVEVLKKADYHLVILDMMMPQMSGTDVLDEIRNVDTDVAVIIATAYPAVDTAVASL
jgi:DNA-binding NtrC family response regulator